MAKIDLCIKICWFIYAQIVLLHLAHHHQSANANELLKVYFDPPEVQYNVTVSEVIDFDEGTYKIIANGLRTKTQPDGREMIKLNKTRLADFEYVSFIFVRSDGSNALGVVSGDEAREEKELAFDYYENGGKLRDYARY
ncbi:hypothetical protein GPALN_006055 [Globodera pallida]|nr:hypothetical protein GPALN_006055 [Globodera pallida]